MKGCGGKRMANVMRKSSIGTMMVVCKKPDKNKIAEPNYLPEVSCENKECNTCEDCKKYWVIGGGTYDRD
jgi:hypothetical protein